MPKVYSKRAGKSYPENAVLVDRTTKWGNPFEMQSEEDRDRVCDQYEEWVNQQYRLLDDIRYALQGMDLVCWCAPKRCHADTLLEIANRYIYCDVCGYDYDTEDDPFGCPQH